MFDVLSGLIPCWAHLIINSHDMLELAPHFLFFSSDKRVFFISLFIFFLSSFSGEKELYIHVKWKEKEKEESKKEKEESKSQR